MQPAHQCYGFLSMRLSFSLFQTTPYLFTLFLPGSDPYCRRGVGGESALLYFFLRILPVFTVFFVFAKSVTLVVIMSYCASPMLPRLHYFFLQFILLFHSIFPYAFISLSENVILFVLYPFLKIVPKVLQSFGIPARSIVRINKIYCGTTYQRLYISVDSFKIGI